MGVVDQIDRMMAVAMVKYSITTALNLSIRVDPCSYDMGGGPHIDSFNSGAVVIDLIFY
jgi:hypothetical protein